LSYPFGGEKNGYKPFQINASNELFFTNNEPYFERNRASISLNYKPTKTTILQLGYLHQFDYQINDETGRDFLQIGYFIDLFRRQSASNKFTSEIRDN
jgi:UDP-N-acetylglucosamine pyrophosphorylase